MCVFLKRYLEINDQYDDFQKQSAEIENELELSLKQCEERIKSLENKNSRLSFDYDSTKVSKKKKKKFTCQIFFLVRVPPFKKKKFSKFFFKIFLLE
jgi:hypothetical protein